MEENPMITNDTESKRKERKEKLIIFAIVAGCILCSAIGFAAGQYQANASFNERVAAEVASQNDADIYAYALQMDGNYDQIKTEISDLGDVLQSYDETAEWYALAGKEVGYIRELMDESYTFDPPRDAMPIHNQYMKGIGEMREAVALFVGAAGTKDSQLLDLSYNSTAAALKDMQAASDQLDELQGTKREL